MAARRKLSQRIQSPDNVDPEAMRAFVTQERKSAPTAASNAASETSSNTFHPPTSGVHPVGLIPVTVRLSPEIAGALKRASLERQLSRADYFSQQEIVERCLRVWLRENGHLQVDTAN